MVVTTRGPATAAAIPAAEEAEPMASEVDVPWSIALLSDADAPLAKDPGRVVVVEGGPEVHEPASAEDVTGLEVVVDHYHGDEKPTTPKSCSGVVKGRS